MLAILICYSFCCCNLCLYMSCHVILFFFGREQSPGMTKLQVIIILQLFPVEVCYYQLPTIEDQDIKGSFGTRVKRRNAFPRNGWRQQTFGSWENFQKQRRNRWRKGFALTVTVGNEKSGSSSWKLKEPAAFLSYGFLHPAFFLRQSCVPKRP